MEELRLDQVTTQEQSSDQTQNNGEILDRFGCGDEEDEGSYFPYDDSYQS